MYFFEYSDEGNRFVLMQLFFAFICFIRNMESEKETTKVPGQY